MFKEMNHILGHKTNLKIFKRIKIIQSIIINRITLYYKVKLNINKIRTVDKYPNVQELNTLHLNNSYVKEKS